MYRQPLAFLSMAAICFGLTGVHRLWADDAQAEMERLQGEWKVVSAERGGKATPDEEASQMSLVFDGNKATLKIGTREEKLIYTLDSKKSPKEINLWNREFDNENAKVLGIYELDGDSLKMCWGRPGNKDRAKEFKTTKESQEALLVLKKKVAE